MDDHPQFIGVEIGGTKLQAALGSSEGVVFEMRRVSADAAGGAATIRQQVCQLIESWVESGAVAAIGIGFGGPVDETAGRVTQSHQVRDWEGFDLRGWVREEFGLRFAVANDSDLAAWAEARLGAGREFARVFYTNIGSGIGGGFAVDGERYLVPDGSMEFGQTWAYSALEQRWDRLELLCSGWALVQRMQKLGIAAGSGDAVKSLLESWRRGDVATSRLVEDFLETYGRSLANAIALLNPDVVVIGGGVMNCGEPLVTAIRAAVAKFVFVPFADNFKLVRAELGEASVPVGALLLAGRAIESQAGRS